MHFDLAAGANVGNCVVVYTWTFPEGTASSGTPGQNHPFATTGSFTVTLNVASASSAFTGFTVTTPVAVVAPATVPALAPAAAVLLLTVLALIALGRLHG